MITFSIAILGLLIGSFFNVLIWRIPREESVIFPASHCTQCGRKIKPWENIPVISYLFLKGKCAGCKQDISIVYPLTEVLTAALAVVLWYTIIPHHPLSWQQSIQLSIQVLFLMLMLPMAVIDIKHYIIPDIFSLSLLFISLGISFIPGNTTPLQSIVGIITGGGILWGIGKIGSIILKKDDAMGGGDIKLMAAVGALWGPEIAIIGIIFGAFLGTLTGIPLLLFKKLQSDHHIPFGPFLGAGLWIAVIAGYSLISSYINLIDKLLIR